MVNVVNMRIAIVERFVSFCIENMIEKNDCKIDIDNKTIIVNNNAFWVGDKFEFDVIIYKNDYFLFMKKYEFLLVFSSNCNFDKLCFIFGEFYFFMGSGCFFSFGGGFFLW